MTQISTSLSCITNGGTAQLIPSTDITSLLRRLAALVSLADDGDLHFLPDAADVASLIGRIQEAIPTYNLTAEEVTAIALLSAGARVADSIGIGSLGVQPVLEQLKTKGIADVIDPTDKAVAESNVAPVATLRAEFVEIIRHTLQSESIMHFDSPKDYLLHWFSFVKRVHRYRENERNQHTIHGLASKGSRTGDPSPTGTESKFAHEERELIKRSLIEWERFPVERIVHQLGLDSVERRILLYVLMCELDGEHCTTEDLIVLTSVDAIDGFKKDRYWRVDSRLRLYDLITMEESRRRRSSRTPVTMRNGVRRWLTTGEGQLAGITDLDDSEPYANEYEHIEDWIRLGRMWVRLSRLAGADRRDGDEDEVDLDDECKRCTSTHPMFISMKARIDRKTKASGRQFPLDILTARYGLSDAERDILILMIEAVSSGRDLDQDDLTMIMSSDLVERHKIESLLLPDSKLVMNGLVLTTPRRNGTYEIALPLSVRNYLLGVSETIATTATAIALQSDLLSLVTTDKTLDDLILPHGVMEVVRNVVRSHQTNADALLRSWGILPPSRDLNESTHGRSLTCLISGSPGVGKTHMAYCLAGSLGKDLLVTDCSRLLSVWVSESEKNVSKLFSTYASIVRNSDNSPCLLLNEVDQFWSRRGTSSERSVDRMYHQMQNLFLENLEVFEGVLLCTTNLVESLDPAFSRRMLVKLNIPMPDAVARRAIWSLHLKAPIPLADDVDLGKLTEMFEFSGGAIRNCVTLAATNAAVRGDIVRMDDLVAACKAEERGAFDSTGAARRTLVGFITPEPEHRMQERVHSG